MFWIFLEYSTLDINAGNNSPKYSCKVVHLTDDYNGNYFCLSALQPGINKIPLTLKTAYYPNVK